MAVKEYDKIKIAECQINTACKLHLSGEDYFSSLTIAGAAEEILGKLADKYLNTNALEKEVELFIQMKDLLRDSLPGIKEVSLGDADNQQKRAKDFLNRPKNQVKHIDTNQENNRFLKIDPLESSADMIRRVIDNYYSLTGVYTEHMIDFLNLGKWINDRNES